MLASDSRICLVHNICPRLRHYEVIIVLRGELIVLYPSSLPIEPLPLPNYLLSLSGRLLSRCQSSPHPSSFLAGVTSPEQYQFLATHAFSNLDLRR